MFKIRGAVPWQQSKHEKEWNDAARIRYHSTTSLIKLEISRHSSSSFKYVSMQKMHNSLKELHSTSLGLDTNIKIDKKHPSSKISHAGFNGMFFTCQIRII